VRSKNACPFFLSSSLQGRNQIPWEGMMKKLIFVLLVGLMLNIAQAETSLETFKALMGAINASTELGFSAPFLIPGYGVEMTGGRYRNYATDGTKDLGQIKGLVTALATSVRGLDPAIWVSFHIRYSGDDVDVVLRQKFADLGKVDKWETWANGELVKP
jgi:hypothetical protein